jgi:hypothetical protein
MVKDESRKCLSKANPENAYEFGSCVQEILWQYITL